MADEEGVYVIPKHAMHEWILKRCLPQLPHEIQIDLERGRLTLIAELEEIDCVTQLKTRATKTWRDLLAMMSNLAREEDSGTSEGEGLRRPGKEEGESTVAG